MIVLMNTLITPELLYGAAALAAALGMAAGMLVKRKRPVLAKAPVMRPTGRYRRTRRQG